MEQQQTIVPFGKYKGQPIERLLANEKYCEWLVAQDGIKQRYPNVYTMIVHNYNTQPVDTPEHNKMQMRFLSDEYCIKLAMILGHATKENADCWCRRQIDKGIDKIKYDISEAKAQKALYLRWAPGEPNHPRILAEQKKIDELERLVEAEKLKIESVTAGDVYRTIHDKTFEPHGGGDVTFLIDGDCDMGQFLEWAIVVEIKPTVGDDFPSVLRQMKTMKPENLSGYRRTTVLVLGEYTGVGASFDDFKQYFANEGISVVKAQEIDDFVLPAKTQKGAAQCQTQ